MKKMSALLIFALLFIVACGAPEAVTETVSDVETAVEVVEEAVTEAVDEAMEGETMAEEAHDDNGDEGHEEENMEEEAMAEEEAVVEETAMEEEAVAEEAAMEEEAVVEETAMEEEAVAEEAAMVEVESKQVEISLIDPIDGVTNSYCIDIAGGNQNVDPANGLQAHTCYSYQGDLGSDQVFDTAGFANGILYMPVYDVCAQVASASAGAEIGLAACDGSELQSFVFGESGTISPAGDTSLCFTASSDTRFGRSDVHQISDMSLAACSDDLAIYQEWGYRATLEEAITVISN